MSASGAPDDSDDDFIPDDRNRIRVRPQQRPVKRQKSATGKENAVRSSGGRSKGASALPTQPETRCKSITPAHQCSSRLHKLARPWPPLTALHPSPAHPSQLPSNPVQPVRLQISSSSHRFVANDSRELPCLAPSIESTSLPATVVRGPAAAEQQCPVCKCNL